MRFSKNLRLFIIYLFSFFLLACDDSSNCSEPCTEEFRSIVVNITNQGGDVVALDSYRVVEIDTGNDMTIALDSEYFDELKEEGNYILVDDSSLEINQERDVRFEGFINGEEVISSNYTVGTDCCHIGLIDGELNLVL